MVRCATRTSSRIDPRISSWGTPLYPTQLYLQLPTQLTSNYSPSSQSLTCPPHPWAHQRFPTTATGFLAPSGQWDRVLPFKTGEMRTLIRALGVLQKLDLEGPTTTPPRVCSSPPSELPWTFSRIFFELCSWTEDQTDQLRSTMSLEDVCRDATQILFVLKARV